MIAIHTRLDKEIKKWFPNKKASHIIYICVQLFIGPSKDSKMSKQIPSTLRHPFLTNTPSYACNFLRSIPAYCRI